MKKRLVSTLLALCMALMLLPGIAHADGGVTVITNEDGTEYLLYPDYRFSSGETSVVDEWSWDADDRILTLKGYRGKRIACGDVQKIVLADGSSNILEIMSIECAYSNESLIIEGTGELIVTSNFRLAAYDGPIILEDSLQMTGGTKPGDSDLLTYDKNIKTVQRLKTSTGEEATYIRIAPSGSSTPVKEEPAPADNASFTATPTASTVLVNGEETAFDAYNIADNNYFKLRDLACVLSGSAKQFEVTWDEAANAIVLTSGKAYTVVGGEMTSKGAGSQTATPTTSKIMLDGTEISLTAYQIGGNNYFKLRDIGAAFDFGVDWDGAAETIRIDTSKGYTPD